LWSREIEGGSFATPERRAALEARIRDLTGGIRDEVVQRYYRQDFPNVCATPSRLKAAIKAGIAMDLAAGFAGRDRVGLAAIRPGFSPSCAVCARRGRAERGARRPIHRRARLRPRPVSGGQSATRRVLDHAGQRSALSRREALILLSLLNHPWLLHDHLEEIAALELAHPEAHKLRAGIIGAFSNYSHTDDPAAESVRLRATLDRLGYSEQIQRVERAITTKNVWGAQPGAAQEDVLATWHQLVALHRQSHALLRELKDAEQALAQESTEANEAWLRDVKARQADADGLDALIEGFGDPRAGSSAGVDETAGESL
jgi:DNA primase